MLLFISYAKALVNYFFTAKESLTASRTQNPQMTKGVNLSIKLTEPIRIFMPWQDRTVLLTQILGHLDFSEDEFLLHAVSREQDD
jgi:hypothetical protein